MSLDFLKSPVFMRVCAGCANGNEATAFTDPENEAVIQASIAGLVAGKTLIVIAHRLSTITKADKILVVEKGNVAAEGTHEELLEASDLYKELWKAHMQGRDTAEEVAG